MVALAGQRKMHCCTAVLMRERQWTTALVGDVLVTPLHKGDQGRVQVKALLGQTVFVPLALALSVIRRARQDTLFHERVQPIGEYRPGDVEVALEVSEATDAEERLTQHQQAPLFPDHLQRSGDRASSPIHLVCTHGSSIPMLSSFDEPRSNEAQLGS